MKVLLINKFHYLKGGSETYYFGLGELLKKQGHEVIYFSMKDKNNFPCDQDKYFVDNVDFNKPMSKLQMAKCGLKMLYSFEAKRKIEQLIKDEKPDIAHLNIFQSQLTGSIVDVLYKYKIPMVYTMHDLKPICPTYLMLCRGEICQDCIHGNYKSCIRKKCMKDSLAKSILAVMEAKIYRWKKTYDKLDLIITPSDYHKNHLQEAGVTKTKVVRMRNFLPANIRFVEEVKAGNYFLYFGRISQEKGILTLIRAFAKSNTETPLYIVGKGPLDQEVALLVKKLNIQERVKILGFKSGEELQEIVRGAKCVILPSECSENAPLSILEAMAAGRPVIVSRNGGLPEIIDDDGNGYIFTPKDVDDLSEKLERYELMSDEELISMGEKSQIKVRQMADANRYVNNMVKLYQRII